MAANLNGLLPPSLCEKIKRSRIFMIGAGGIGCELLKNIVLAGFQNIELIDLDTIDVSNLNRQFLFRRDHVGKSKAEIAKLSAEKFNPNSKITYYHDNIKSNKFDVDFFGKFDVVLNALDNKSARVHVNRMCLAANVPLIESGTAGYLGQTTVIKKDISECYECQPIASQKTYPGCTIRNTPSELIHCIVWAKHLFNQLFGEADADEEVSPDAEDPETIGDAGVNAQKNLDFERISTRTWAKNCNYNSKKLFNKLFKDDIKYLLSMSNLWAERQPPIPLDFNELTDEKDDRAVLPDQKIWSVKQCFSKFESSIENLKNNLENDNTNEYLVWDKDDENGMDFVTAAACIRAFIFNIPLKSRFDIKSMAGNIIPAIATTNAVIAALVVLQAIKVIDGKIEECKHLYLNEMPNVKNKLPIPGFLDKPNPKCYVCSKPSVTLCLKIENTTLQFLQDRILKSHFGMVAPDVEVDDGKGTIIISSDEDETTSNMDKKLSDFGIKNRSVLKCDDFLQKFYLHITLANIEKFDDDKEFDVIGNLDELKEKMKNDADNNKSSELADKNDTALNDDDDDVFVVNDESEDVLKKKRKADMIVDSPLEKRIKSDNDDICINID